MRDDYEGRVDLSRELRDGWQVQVFPDLTLADVAAGELGTAGEVYAAEVQSCDQTSTDCRVVLTSDAGLDPRHFYGVPIALRSTLDGGATVWSGVVQTVGPVTRSTQGRSIVLVAKSRAALPLWQIARWVTDVYPVGTDLGQIARDVVAALGLEPHEYAALQAVGRATPHSAMQLAELTGWQMLEQLLLPVGLEPWVDALGRMKPVSRDVRRLHDLEIPSEAVLGFTDSGPAIDARTSSVLLSWLDRKLSRSEQQDQVLAQATIPAGYFKLEQRRRVYWSTDRRQRAVGTYLKTLQSVNAGLLPVGTEEYMQLDEYSGEIVVTSSAWVPTLAGASLAALIASSKIPDIAPGGLSPAPTKPVGRVVHAIGEVGILVVMMSVGTGSYEVWGRPFDYVHATNKSEAYATDVPQYARVQESIVSDLVTDEPHAGDIVRRELAYRYLSASRISYQMRDFPLIERGDILLFPDSVRLYVEDYSRSIRRGAGGVLTVSGFRV